jgi:hypothetical protein
VALTAAPVAAPDLAEERERTRRVSLQSANEVRRARALLKREIADGTASAAGVLLNPPAAASRWSVGELLISQRHWGEAKCKKYLARAEINESKMIRELTERQRLLLARELLRRRAGRSATRSI